MRLVQIAQSQSMHEVLLRELEFLGHYYRVQRDADRAREIESLLVEIKESRTWFQVSGLEEVQPTILPGGQVKWIPATSVPSGGAEQESRPVSDQG